MLDGRSFIRMVFCLTYFQLTWLSRNLRSSADGIPTNAVATVVIMTASRCGTDTFHQDAHRAISGWQY